MVSVLYANERPTIQFDGKTYYLAQSANELDSQYTPINVVEFYLPVGETSDNYSRYIKRVTMLEVSDFNQSAKSRLSEFLEDNKHIPFEIIEDKEGQKIILNVTFWWPFRPTMISKKIYVFQSDKDAKRAMYYLVGEDQFYNSTSISNEDLIKQGKALLMDAKIINEAKKLSF
jgi:hypothetical protein